MQIPRTIRFPMLLAPTPGVARPGARQAVSGHALPGDWVRIDGNDPNDQERDGNHCPATMKRTSVDATVRYRTAHRSPV